MEDADEEVEDALVDAELRERETAASGYIDESPAPQRSIGHQGAPVRAGQRRQREAEGGIGTGRIVMGRGTQRSKGAVKLNGGAEQ